MAKWYGEIGYAIPTETSPGVWVDKITKRNHCGDLNRNTRRLESSGAINDDINISNELSIVADPYAVQHFHSMRYAMVFGAAWKIVNVEVQTPRLKLTLGGKWNGQQA